MHRNSLAYLINNLGVEICETGSARGVFPSRDGESMGTDGGTVGVGRAGVASGASGGQSRSSVAGHAGGVERGVLGSGHGCAVVGASLSIPALPDLPPSFPAVDTRRQIGGGLAAAGAASA